MRLASSPDSTPALPHLTYNLQQTKTETTNVVINISHKLLMTGIVMPETCLTYKKYNKTISGI